MMRTVPSASASVTVVIPTYRRSDRLRQALRALETQARQADEIIVVRRSDDAPAAAVVRERWRLPLREVIVQEPGVLAAMIAGARGASGSLIAFIDDDAAPHADWLQRMVALVAEYGVGGVGGRDIVTVDDALPRTADVGRITAWGKLIGDHHRAAGPPLDVDVLKAANMLFRREALALPRGLRGAGAQVHFEIATCLWAHDRGWRLVMDPGAEVDHLPGPRFDADRRGAPAATATFDAAYNLTIALMTMRSALAPRRLVYGLVVGDRGAPGLLRAMAAIQGHEWFVARRLIPSLGGQLLAVLHAARGARLEMTTFPHPARTPSSAD